VICACSSGLPVRAAHATLHATVSRLGLRTEGRSIQKIGLPSSDLHGTLFMTPIRAVPTCGRVNIGAGLRRIADRRPGMAIVTKIDAKYCPFKRSKSGGHPDGCRLNEFFERPPPCVGVSGKHHARLIRECRWKSTTVALQTGCDAVGNRQDWQPTFGLGKKKQK
jgi:hypothetical protein